MDGDEEIRGNISVESVQSTLEQQRRKGRSAPEAAGEVLWLANVQQDMSLLSNESHENMSEVVDEWLARELNVPIDQLGPFRFEATEYAKFLRERVNLAPPTNPYTAVDQAWVAWREKIRRS